jgi:uncharacterized protein
MELNIAEFAQDYVAVWNEPDAGVRRRSITELWTEDAVQYLSSTEYRGHRELESRVGEAHESFVAAGGFVFVLAGEPLAHHDNVVLRTDMIPAGGGDIAWSGTSILELAADGRIRREHQYALPLAAVRA